MNPSRKIEPEKIHLLNIRTVRGNIDSKNEADSESVAGHTFSFEVQSGMDTDKNIIGLLLTIDIEAVDNSDQPLGIRGSYTHELIFQTENMLDFVEEKERDGKTEKIIDSLLVSTLIGIGYSTVRGIIFSRTQGTSLNSVIIPIIDPKKLMVNPVKNNDEEAGV